MIARERFEKYVQFIFDVFSYNFYSFENLLRVKNKIFIIYDPNDSIIPFSCSGIVGYWQVLARMFTTGSKYLMPSSNLFKSNNLRYIPNLKKSLVYTHNQLNRYKKIEKSLDMLMGKANLPQVFSALNNLFKVITERDIKNNTKVGSYSPKVHHNHQLNFEALKDCLNQNLDRTQDIEADHNPYPELISKVYEKEKEFKFFFTKYVSILDGLVVDDISLYELFKTNGLTYPTFVIYIWTVFVYTMASQGAPNFNNTVKEQLKDLAIKLERLACDIFALREQFILKLNPYNTLPAIQFLRDVYTISSFFKDFSKRFTETENNVTDVDISFSSHEDILVNEDKHNMMARAIDWELIRSVITKVQCVRVDYGHNTKLRKQELEKIIESMG